MTMRAWSLEALGYDGLRLTTRPIPTPGPGQVLVKLHAASLNFRDLKILNGVYARQPQLPIVPVSDGAGEITAIGPGVTSFAPGDRVVLTYMEGWHTGPQTAARDGWRGKGGDVDGTALEYGVYDQADVLPIPDSLTYEEAACLPCAAVTAWHALVYTGHVKTGDTVLVMGGGGVSLAALQIAHMSGARVIAISSSDDRLARMRELGATGGINYATTPDWAPAIRALTRGRGVDHVVEVGGDATMAQSIAATKDGGHVAVTGNLTGKFGSPDRAERGIRVSTISVGSREMTVDLIRAIDLHGAKPVIDRSFPFTELQQALAYLETGKHFGKVVLRF
jgi:NADPH:quinone reductase-like Zn-dependent oxidoreductase